MIKFLFIFFFVISTCYAGNKNGHYKNAAKNAAKAASKLPEVKDAIKTIEVRLGITKDYKRIMGLLAGAATAKIDSKYLYKGYKTNDFSIVPRIIIDIDDREFKGLVDLEWRF